MNSLTLPAFYQAQINCLLLHQQAIEAELAKRNLQDLPLEKLFRLSDLLSRQLQRLLKVAAPSSDVEVAILAAGQGGFQPPVPAQPPSIQIKATQASDEIATTGAPSSEFKVQSSAFEVQGSPVPRPATAPSAPDPANLQPATCHLQPSPSQEHCLLCGAPLPPLLPNGRRPDRYCKCGHPMPGAPGTSLREHCPHCDALQPVHGYNAARQVNRCCQCGRDLPPLDPRSRTPWLPPTRSPISK